MAVVASPCAGLAHSLREVSKAESKAKTGGGELIGLIDSSIHSFRSLLTGKKRFTCSK